MAKFDNETQRGLKAHDLLTEYPVVNDRLAAGFKAALATKLVELGASIPDQISTRQGSKQSTSNQGQAMENLSLLLTAIRDNVKNDSDATAQDKKEYGYGLDLDPRNPKKVLAAAQSMLKVATDNPQRAQLLGILPTDLTQLAALKATAAAADSEQDSKRAKAPLSTKKRNALLEDVKAATRKVGGAGVLEFAMNAKVRAEFEALLDRPTKRGGGSTPPAS